MTDPFDWIRSITVAHIGDYIALAATPVQLDYHSDRLPCPRCEGARVLISPEPGTVYIRPCPACGGAGAMTLRQVVTFLTTMERQMPKPKGRPLNLWTTWLQKHGLEVRAA